MDKQPVDYHTRERLRVGADEITVLATSGETGDALFAVEVRMPPGGGPPVLHRHAPGEVYHVLEGEFTFYLDGGDGLVRRTAGAGEVVPMAGGIPHAVRNESASDAVAFVVHAPGRPMEGFIRAGAEHAARAELTMDVALAIAARHGIEMLGPIPAAG